MSILKFLVGTDFIKKTIDFKPGSIYLDSSTGEMWYDDPKGVLNEHSKIVDLDTLVYQKIETIEIADDLIPGLSPLPEAESTTAKLGFSILGKMKLGQS